MLLAVAAESGSWAHLVGLLAAATLAVVGVGTHQWWMHYRDPSPTPPEDDDIDATPGETLVSDNDDTDLDTEDDTLPEGRYRLTDGSILVRAWQPPHASDVDVDLELDDPDEDETREEMAERLVQGGGSYADWVREIMGAFDVSEATAKRAIRDARERIDA